MISKIEGFLEIQHHKGVILFQCTNANDVRKFGRAILLRVHGLEIPIPNEGETFDVFLDIEVEQTKWNNPEGVLDISPNGS